MEASLMEKPESSPKEKARLWNPVRIYGKRIEKANNNDLQPSHYWRLVSTG
jgi:hypothetical protein